MGVQRVFLTNTGTTSTFVVPSDFISFISVEAIGNGGSGGSRTGGGGGAYAYSNLLTGISVGTTLYYYISFKGSNTATWISTVTNVPPTTATQGVLAQPGANGTTTTTTILGGSSSTSIGTITYSGGNSGAGSFNSTYGSYYSGGGGGAAGPQGPGRDGGNGGNNFLGSGYGGGGGGANGGTSGSTYNPGTGPDGGNGGRGSGDGGPNPNQSSTTGSSATTFSVYYGGVTTYYGPGGGGGGGSLSYSGSAGGFFGGGDGGSALTSVTLSGSGLIVFTYNSTLDYRQVQRLTSTGTLLTNYQFDEVTKTINGIDAATVYSKQFDEVTLKNVRTVFFTNTGTGTYTIPSDFVALYSIEAIGAGAYNGNGGGGGAYAKSTRVFGLFPGSTAYYRVGTPTTSLGGSYNTLAESWFTTTSTASPPTTSTQGVKAQGGTGGNTNILIGQGGRSQNCIGEICYSGGDTGHTQPRSGSGAAAGPDGPGGNGGGYGGGAQGSGGGGANGGSNGGSSGGVGTNIGGNGGSGKGNGFRSISGGNGATGTPTSGQGPTSPPAGSGAGGGGGGFYFGAAGTSGASGSLWVETATGNVAGPGGGGGGGGSTGGGGLYGGGSSSATGAQGIIVFRYVSTITNSTNVVQSIDYTFSNSNTNYIAREFDEITGIIN